MSQQEIPDSFFTFAGRTVKVHGVANTGEKYHCPRDRSSTNNVEVYTDDGLMLYCFDCGIFYYERGHWGYKTQ